MVAHELRAPLGAISQYLDVVMGGVVANDPDRQAGMLRRCKDRASSLLGLIDDLLDLSTIEAGHVARELEPLRVGSLLAETVEVFRAQAEARDISVSLDVPIDLPLVMADRRDLGRVFTNLLSNAIKYNRDGGRVEIRVRRDSGRLRIDFADTGFGIPPEAQGHLFEEFYRVKMAATERVTGTGLGLSIVKRLVEAHQGAVTALSELGAGSTFSVVLPVLAESGVKKPVRTVEVTAEAAG
jgi:signal transduction histidine kinase